MKLFHRHSWEIKKAVLMYMDGPRKTWPYTRVWYSCTVCKSVKVKDWSNHLTWEEVKDMFPTP